MPIATSQFVPLCQRFPFGDHKFDFEIFESVSVVRISSFKHMEHLTNLPVILEQGPCSSSLHRSNSSVCAAEACLFLGPRPRRMEVPRLGLNWSYSCEPTPQLEQHRIQAASATYATAPGNAGSLTH